MTAADDLPLTSEEREALRLDAAMRESYDLDVATTRHCMAQFADYARDRYANTIHALASARADAAAAREENMRLRTYLNKRGHAEYCYGDEAAQECICGLEAALAAARAQES